MRIQTIDASEVISLESTSFATPTDLAVSPTSHRSIARDTRIGRGKLGPIDRARREILAEALLDGFLGADDADYQGLVAFTRKLRDHSPALAVQLLKPLLRTDATPSVHVEQQAVFMLGDMPQDMQQQIASACSEAAKQQAIDVQ